MLDQAQRAGWPLHSWVWSLSPLCSAWRVAVGVRVVFPILDTTPDDASFVADGSWFVDRRCGGAFAAGCLTTG